LSQFIEAINRIAPEAPANAVDRGTIEIEFPTGARMRITGTLDASVLTAAVAVLAEGRRR
jgi:transposase